MELEIFKELQKNLKNLIPVSGLKFKFGVKPFSEHMQQPGFFADVSYKDVKFKVIGEVIAQKSLPIFRDKLSLLKSYVKKNQLLLPIIVTQYLSPERQKQCKDAGIYFLDLSGNIFLKHEGIYIERVGYPNRFPEKRKGRGPFSDKASLILRAIMSDIGKLWGVRELAHYVKLDPGFVSRIARELESQNYIVRVNSKIKLRDPKDILDDWARVYNFKKNKQVRYFCLARSTDEVFKMIRNANIAKEVRYGFGVQAGANLIAPYAVFNEVHLYVHDQYSIDFFVKLLKLKEAEQGANVIFLLPHYKHSVFYGKQKIGGLIVVSDIQLYIDLYNFPIRGLEQAEHLYNKRLKKFWGSSVNNAG